MQDLVGRGGDNRVTPFLKLIAEPMGEDAKQQISGLRPFEMVLNLGHTALKGQKNKVSPAANSKLIEQVGDVEFNGAFRNVKLAGDFFVGKIFEKRIENFLFAAAEVGDGLSFETTSLAGQNGIDEAREHGSGTQKPPCETRGSARAS